MTDDDSTFAKLVFNLRNYAKDVELYGKALIDKLSLDIEYDRSLPSSSKAKLDDFISERNEVMKEKIPTHRRSSDLVRHLNSMGLLIENYVELMDKEEHAKFADNEAANDAKDIQTLFHVNGKLKYKGNIINNEYHGQGILYHYNGILLYKGQFENGEPDGEDCDIFYFNSNLKYKGAVNKGVYNGYGELYHDNGCLKFKGNFRDDKPDSDEANIYHRNGNLEYYGKIDRGYFSEFGCLYHKNSNLEYEGYFSKGGPHSLRGEETIIYYDNGQIKYKGICIEGYFQGNGILYNRKGVIEYKGVFNRGQPIDDKTMDAKGALNSEIQELSLSEISADEKDTHEFKNDGDHYFYSTLPVMKPGPPIEKIPSIASNQNQNANTKTTGSKAQLNKKGPSKSPMGGGTANNYRSQANVTSKPNSRTPSGIPAPAKKAGATQDKKAGATQDKKASNAPVQKTGKETTNKAQNKTGSAKKGGNDVKKPVKTPAKPESEMTVQEKLARDLKQLELRKRYDPQYPEKELYFTNQEDCQLRERDMYQIYEIPEGASPKKMPMVNQQDLSPHKYREDSQIVYSRASPSISPERLRYVEANPNHFIKFREYKNDKPIPPPPKVKANIAPPPKKEHKKVGGKDQAQKDKLKNDQKKVNTAMLSLVPNISAEIKQKIMGNLTVDVIGSIPKGGQDKDSPLIKKLKAEAALEKGGKPKSAKKKGPGETMSLNIKEVKPELNLEGKFKTFNRSNTVQEPRGETNALELKLNQVEELPEPEVQSPVQSPAKSPAKSIKKKGGKKKKAKEVVEEEIASPSSINKYTITRDLEDRYYFEDDEYEGESDLSEGSYEPIQDTVKGKINMLANFLGGKNKKNRFAHLDTSKF